MSPNDTNLEFDPRRQFEIARRAIEKRSFCVLATSSAANKPHAVGILYAVADLKLYLLMSENSIKIRNVRQNPNVAISIPVRKYLFGPAMAVQFQGTARILAIDDPHVTALREAGRLKKIFAVDVKDAQGLQVLQVTPGRRISTYGLGVSLRTILRHPELGQRSVAVPQ